MGYSSFGTPSFARHALYRCLGTLPARWLHMLTPGAVSAIALIPMPHSLSTNGVAAARILLLSKPSWMSRAALAFAVNQGLQDLAFTIFVIPLLSIAS